MKKRTIQDEACLKVKGFRQMAEQFMQRLVINGRSRSTHENYLRQIAKMAIFCEKTLLKWKIQYPNHSISASGRRMQAEKIRMLYCFPSAPAMQD